MMGSSLTERRTGRALLLAIVTRLAVLSAGSALVLGGINDGVEGVLVAVCVIAGLLAFVLGIAYVIWTAESL